MPEVWRDDQPLVSLAGDPWRIHDACEGTVIFGGTGSGKTSGSGQTVALSFLSAGFGGLVLCAKREEPDLWRRYAAQTNRTNDLIFFGSDPQTAFNFLEYEARRPGEGAGLTENLVNLFLEVSSIGAGQGATAGGDPFWERSMKSLIRNAIDLIQLAGSRLTLPAIFEVVQSAPDLTGQAQEAAWKEKSACWRLLQDAEANTIGTAAEADFRQVSGYWLRHYPGMGERTRGSIVAMFLSVAESLMRGRMRELFCEKSTVTPEDALRGKIIVVDLPVKEWSEVGRFSAVLWKYCLQKAVERRGDNADRLARPLFLWADECQHFISRYDQLFQTTARSSRAATVYLTQNYPNLTAALGADPGGRSVVDSLLGNLGTKIFHANSDHETNRYAADLIGRRLQTLRNSGTSGSLSGGGSLSLGSSRSHGISEHIDYSVQPAAFTTLRKGGLDNALRSEAYVFQSGRVWSSTRATWQKVAFDQVARLRHESVPPPLPRLGRGR